MEYWKKDLVNAGIDVQAAMLKDTGHGIITKDTTEPLYGKAFMDWRFCYEMISFDSDPLHFIAASICLDRKEISSSQIQDSSNGARR